MEQRNLQDVYRRLPNWKKAIIKRLGNRKTFLGELIRDFLKAVPKSTLLRVVSSTKTWKYKIL